jgi:hypothetical protein
VGYLLILLGLALVALTFRSALFGQRGPAEDRTRDAAAVEPAPAPAAWEQLMERLSALERRLMEDAAEPAGPVLPPEAAGEAAPEGGATAFDEVLAHTLRDGWRQEVYAAYDAGEDVESIARRLGRGRGEIELILRLRSGA